MGARARAGSAGVRLPPLARDVVGRRAEILDLGRRHGIAHVRLFGSAARGDAHAGSDLDFLVTLDAGRTLFDLGAFWHQLGQLLGREVDVVLEESLDPVGRERILTEAIAL